jgi:hypothetical protein
MSEIGDDITLFARTNFRDKRVPFGIKRDDRRKHMYLIGKTGMGKSTMMENMVIQDIINGEGVALVDPHGDLVAKVLDFIPSNRVNDVIYFNPSDMEFPIAFNILESVDNRYKHLVASGLMGVFTKIWADMWSARMEYILNNAILALLDSPGNTLLGIARILIDKKYRKKIVDNVKDPMVRSFWVDEYANWSEKYRTEAIAAIQNKIGQFLSSGIIRNIVGQPRSTLDLREVMDNRKILLLNLSKGSVGEDNSALLGAMLITKLQLAALSRVDVLEEERKDFYLYVDEFQNFATDSFATILSEARKYRLNLIIGHQYIGQLVQERNTKVRDAVFGNVGTIVAFRIGAADAEFMEKEFMPQFTENDLVNLPKHNIMLKLMINGVASDPFTAETLPPSLNDPTGNAEKIIRVSRERYANPIADVETKILKWMDQDYHDTMADIAGGKVDPKTVDLDIDVELKPSEVEAKLVGQAVDQRGQGNREEEIENRKEEETPQAMTVAAEVPVPEPVAPPIQQKPVYNPDDRRKNNEDRRHPRPPSSVSYQEKHPDHRDGQRKSQKKQSHKKDDNPIWAKAMGNDQRQDKEGLEDIVNKLSESLSKIETKPSRSETTQPPQTQSQGVVLKPGEVSKLEDI